MAEDIDKLIEWLRYIKADILARAEREYGRVPTEDKEDAACVEAASAELDRLRSRVSELEAERDRTLRNRDMWKGQCERQAATLHDLRVAASPTPPAAVGGVEEEVQAALQLALDFILTHGRPETDDGAHDTYQRIEAALNQLQRERGAIAGRDGKSVSCALKGTGPAASTASDDLVEELKEVISSAWANDFVEPTAEGDVVLERVARSILSRFQSVSGEKHDHADGASAEAVEKITQVDERRQ